jgi:cbb3-type cytochrome oxidase maturation protein
MSALFLLIGFSLLVALIFLSAFFWAMRSDQYKDTHTPAMRILFDDNQPTTTHTQDSRTEVSQ